MDVTHFNALTSPAFRADPMPMLARLRQESPVLRIKPGMLESWHVFGYEDIRSILLDPDRFSSDRSLIGGGDARVSKANLGFLFNNLISASGEKHRRLRMIANRVFMAGGVERFREVCDRKIGQCLDDALDGEVFDVVEGFAAKISIAMISAVLGLPDADRDRIRRWAKVLGANSGAVTWMAEMDHDIEALSLNTALEMRDYFAKYIDERKARPKEGDVISQFLHQEVEGERLDGEEVLSMAMLLLLAGNETTTNLITNFMRRMAMHPQDGERLRVEPDLVDSAVEETVRLHSSIRNIDRYALIETRIGGVTIPAGAQMVLWLSAGNRDPEIFENPDRFDIARKPNRHLGFGTGMHMCLGAHLARLQTRAAARHVLDKTREIQLCGEPVHGPNASFDNILRQDMRFLRR
ncbi:MAG: cytochrome P450 [Rhizobiaceae bacterium]